MVDGRVIRCDVIGNIVVEIAGAVGVRVNEEAPDGFQLKEVVDGVAQQQSARLAHAISLVAQRVGLGGKQAGDLPAGGIGQHRVVLGLNMELFRMLGDVPHGPAHIFQRGVVCRLIANAVPQHKAGIAQLVEPLRRGNTLTHFGAGVDGVAADDQHELAARITAREIIDLRFLAGRHGGDFLVRVELIGDLDAGVVVFDHPVQALGAVLSGAIVDILPQGGIFPLADIPGGVLLLIVSIQPRPHDAGVRPDLGHGSVRCDVGLPFCSRCLGCPCRQDEQGGQ